MLRSIFSLIQNIIDSDNKGYNNKKSSTVIYLVSNSDNNALNMDLELDGKNAEHLTDGSKDDPKGSFKITTEQGDTVTCEHFTDKNIKVKSAGEEKLEEEFKEKVEKLGERVSFSNDEPAPDESLPGKDGSQFVQGDSEPKTVKDVLERLTEKQARIVEKDRDQITALMEQIQKMKTGMERLQEIAQQFNCSDKFKEDVEYLMKNASVKMVDDKPKDKDLSKSER